MASSVILYIGETSNRLDPTTRVIDATSSLAPNGGSYQFANLMPNIAYNVWTKLGGPVGDIILSLGVLRINDTIGPTVDSFNFARNTSNPETTLTLQVTISDRVY